MYFAHSTPDPSRADWEPLPDHLSAVAARAAEFAGPFGWAEAARTAGRLHDIGKLSAEFQAYIKGERSSGGDHSTAGAQVAVADLPKPLGQMLAFIIAGHHAGLADGVALEARLKNREAVPPAGWEALAGPLPRPTAFAPTCRFTPSPTDKGFTQAFLIRMLFSCLVDADFLETERFYAGVRREGDVKRGGHTNLAILRDRLRAHMAEKRAAAAPTEINALRARVLDHVVEQAALAPGLLTLTVPTGGGKTLASLSFALEHDRSAARGEMATRKLIVFRHASALGNAQAQSLFDRVKTWRVHQGSQHSIGDERLDNAPPARSFADYAITVDRNGLPEGVEIIER